MTTVIVRRDVNFKDIEDLSKVIVETPGVVLRIPNSLNTSGAFGVEGFVLQLIATWFRTDGEHILHTYIQNTKDKESYLDLCNTLYGLCALSLSDKLISATKEKINRRFSLLSAVDRINCIRNESFKEAFKGFYLAIPSIKAIGNNSETLNPFYNRDIIVGRNKFYKITKNAIDAVITNDKYRLSELVVSNISEIIRELFTNTHKHARKDVYGNIIERNFRAITFRAAKLSRSRLDNLSKSGGGKLALFIGEWLSKNEKSISVLDITVVDSGPGYARRWTGLSQEELDFDKECTAIVECFKKYKSTDRAESSGSGLSNVLRDLKQLRGWFRLRTGTALIERSFFNQTGNSIIVNNDIQEKEVFVEGVVFNIVIPLQISKEGSKDVFV